MYQKIDSFGVRQRQFVFGALLGTAVVAVFQILTLPVLDRRLIAALYCFAVSIPFLTVSVRVQLVEAACVYRVLAWYVPICGMVGATVWFAGLAVVFFHFSLVIGSVFTSLSLFGLLVAGRYRSRMLQLNNDPPDDLMERISD